MIHFSLAWEIYFSIVHSGSSFEREAISLCISCCTVFAEQVNIRNSTFYKRHKTRALIPAEFSSIGAQSIVPFLEPDDIEVIFFLCGSILRTLRAPRLRLNND